MSTHINTYIDATIGDIKKQIQEANDLISEIDRACPHPAFDGDMDKLAELLRIASDSVDIFQGYGGTFTYDRIWRWCRGHHPGRYEAQCSLCEIQRLCSEETAHC
jgi:hypothetical protein